MMNHVSRRLVLLAIATLTLGAVACAEAEDPNPSTLTGTAEGNLALSLDLLGADDSTLGGLDIELTPTLCASGELSGEAVIDLGFSALADLRVSHPELAVGASVAGEARLLVEHALDVAPGCYDLRVVPMIDLDTPVDLCTSGFVPNIHVDDLGQTTISLVSECGDGGHGQPGGGDGDLEVGVCATAGCWLSATVPCVGSLMADVMVESLCAGVSIQAESLIDTVTLMFEDGTTETFTGLDCTEIVLEGTGENAGKVVATAWVQLDAALDLGGDLLGQRFDLALTCNAGVDVDVDTDGGCGEGGCDGGDTGGGDNGGDNGGGDNGGGDTGGDCGLSLCDGGDGDGTDGGGSDGGDTGTDVDVDAAVCATAGCWLSATVPCVGSLMADVMVESLCAGVSIQAESLIDTVTLMFEDGTTETFTGLDCTEIVLEGTGENAGKVVATAWVQLDAALDLGGDLLGQRFDLALTCNAEAGAGALIGLD